MKLKSRRLYKRLWVLFSALLLTGWIGVITAWLSNQCELGALIAYSLFMAGIILA